MTGLVAFLGRDSIPWLRIEDGAIAARGDDLTDTDEAIVAIAPVEGTALHAAAFGDLSPAQALAAARVEAADVSLGAERHVAVSATGDHYVVTDRDVMLGWIGQMEARGLQAAVLVPAASLLPAPESGFVRAEMPHETVLRSADTALAEDDEIAPLLVDDEPVVSMGAAELELAIVAASSAPPLNLLQGEFLPRADWAAGIGYWRRMVILSGIFLALTMAIPVAHWARLSMATADLDAESAAIASKALGEAAATDDSVDRLQQALAARRGGGLGYVATQAAILAAIESSPGTELGSLAFDPDGTLRATVRGPTPAAIDAVRAALDSRGFAVTQGAQTNNGGRMQADFQVRPR